MDTVKSGSGYLRRAVRWHWVALLALVAGLLPLAALSDTAGATNPPPTITSLSPDNSLSVGGAVVTITGTDFVSPTVTIGGANAPIDSSSLTQIVVTAPPGASGVTSLMVSASGQSASTPFQYDVDIPAVWNGVPDTSCGQWFTSNPPAGTVAAQASVSGAGGGGGGITENSAGHPAGGAGGLVTANLTGEALENEVSAELGCGGGAGVQTLNFISDNGGSGGSGYGSGADGGSTLLTNGGSGGGGGGASALCLGNGTCTKPLLVAGGGGGSGGESDCGSNDGTAGSGGSGTSGSPAVGADFEVASGSGGHHGDSGFGGDGGTANGGGTGGQQGAEMSNPGETGSDTPADSDGGIGGSATSAESTTVSGGGGAGGGYTGGGGGGADSCTDVPDPGSGVGIGTGGNASGGGGAGASAAFVADVSGTSFGTGDAAGGKSNEGRNASSTVTCPEDNNSSLTTGCPGYIDLVYGIPPAPTVTSVSPNSGPTAGGTQVAITGTNLLGATVQFDNIAATNVVVLSSTSVTATSPAGGPGTIDVSVTTPSGPSAPSSADQFTYRAVPTVEGVAPDIGAADGGTNVTITGSSFAGATNVLFGATAAPQFTLNPDGTISAVSPAGTGTADVTVVTAGGTSPLSSADQFTYVPVPTVTSLSPTVGSTEGFTVVTITGTGFSHTTGVFFGSQPSVVTTIISDVSMTALAPQAVVGTVDVTVQNPIGTSAITPADQFTYLVRPAVSSISPTTGPAAGGTPVDIVGSGFTGETGVQFGSVPATNVQFVSSGDITATSPAGAGNSVVDVTVTTPGGTSPANPADEFTYGSATAPPVVDSIAPTSGVAAGGTSVTINGSGFLNHNAVYFNGVLASNVTLGTDSQITATAPPGVGTVDVQVETPNGLSAQNSGDLFTYTPLPVVTSVSPAAGPTIGGVLVSISGTGLTGATSVAFGGTSVTPTVLSDSEITAFAPPESAGAVDVTVTTPGGVSATSPADDFTYLGVPTVTGLEPAAGPATGGQTVGIFGAELQDVSVVRFGSAAATDVTMVNPGFLTAVAPAGSGLVDVTVTTPGGTSVSSPADQFSYVPAPVVASLSPSFGPGSGGGLVTVTGSGFSRATNVSFGATSAVFAVGSDTQLTAVAPPGSGSEDVTVTTAGGSSATGPADVYAYSPEPTVTGVSPNSGLAAGGGQVVITGSGFTGLTWVSFNGAIATNVTAISPTTLSATVPPGSGTKNVSVFTAGGFSAPNNAARFTYFGIPAVHFVSPASGTAAGGTAVTITGTGLSGATSVSFGGVPASTFTVNSDTSITAVTPPGAGSVAVTVAAPGGVSPASTWGRFTYTADDNGYWEVAADGGVFAFGNARFEGSMGGQHLNAPIVGVAPTSDGSGYWEVASDGGIFAFGDAQFFGSEGGMPLNKPIVGLASAPDGKGYWEVASDGGVFSFGDAQFFGSEGGRPLNSPIVGVAPTPSGNGYWEVASDGGVFSFGDARFAGSMGGQHLNAPIVSVAPTSDGNGYWEVASDGGIFSFGDARFEGSMGGQHLNKPIVSVAPTLDGRGYWEVASDGGVFAFGDAVFEGSMGGQQLNAPIVGVGIMRGSTPI